MKVITVWQPWATLIVAGVKPYEFRKASYLNRAAYLHGPKPGERIAIHAAKRKISRSEMQELLLLFDGGRHGLKPEARPIIERALSSPGVFPIASIIGTAVIGEPRDARALFGGQGNDSNRDEHWNWAWPMTDVLRIEPVIPINGKQGFWHWDAPLGVKVDP